MEKKSLGAMLGGIIIGAVAVAVYFNATNFSRVPAVDKNAWSILYLTNGETYVGKINASARNLELTDGYLLVVSRLANKPGVLNFQLVAIKNGPLWSSNRLVVNPKNVLYYGPLEDTSEVVKTLKKAGRGGVVEETK